MTPVRLIKAVAAELREAVKDYKFTAEMQPDKKVNVYEQMLPLAANEDEVQDTYYPCVVVELLGIEDDTTGSVATLLVTIGTYGGATKDGWIDNFNLAETIRQYVLSHSIIGNQFILFPEVYTGVVEPRADFYWFTNLVLKYKIAVGQGSMAYSLH